MLPMLGSSFSPGGLDSRIFSFSYKSLENNTIASFCSFVLPKICSYLTFLHAASAVDTFPLSLTHSNKCWMKYWKVLSYRTRSLVYVILHIKVLSFFLYIWQRFEPLCTQGWFAITFWYFRFWHNSTINIFKLPKAFCNN